VPSHHLKCFHFRPVVENLFAAVKNWFRVFGLKRHHTVYLPIGRAKVEKYCKKFSAQLQEDWEEISQVCTTLQSE
jgi:hypothetical protein